MVQHAHRCKRFHMLESCPAPPEYSQAKASQGKAKGSLSRHDPPTNLVGEIKNSTRLNRSRITRFVHHTNDPVTVEMDQEPAQKRRNRGY